MSGVEIEVGTSVVVLIAQISLFARPGASGRVSTTLMDPRLTGIIRLG